MAVACRFAREVLSAKEADEDGIPLVVPETAGRRGDRPKIARFADAASELAHIGSELRAIHGSGTPWKDMAVLFRTNRHGEQIAQSLARSGVPASLSKKIDPGEDTVKLLTFHSSKGLEFPVVVIPFLESLPYMRDDVPGEAKLLYVGMTRARGLKGKFGDGAPRATPGRFGLPPQAPYLHYSRFANSISA